MESDTVNQSDITHIHIIKKIFNQLQKGVVIIDSTFKILDHNTIFRKMFEAKLHSEVPNDFLACIDMIEQKEKYAQIQSIITNRHNEAIDTVLKGKGNSSLAVTIQCIVLEKNTFLLILEEVHTAQLNGPQLNFVNNTNAILLQDDSFEVKIQQICSEIDYLHHTYTTFTYLTEQNIVLIPSIRFNIQGDRNTQISDEEQSIHQQLLSRQQGLEWTTLSELSLHNETFLYAVKAGYTFYSYVPVYTSSDTPIGYFIIYEAIEQHGDVNNNLDFDKKLNEMVQLIYKIEVHEQQIKRLTYTDTLTNLPSYIQFLKIIERYRLEKKTGVIKIIEPGEFSKIVELYGRPAGEQLLKELGERLKMVCSSEKCDLARFTSSSLIMFIHSDYQSIVQSENFFIDSIKEPFLIDGQQVYITLKAGIAPLEERSSCHDTIRFAESALTKSKLVHGTETTCHIKQADQDLEREIIVLNQFKQAIHNNEITAYFQPKFELHRGRIMSMEALARWISPELGFVSPVEFIPIAENAGLIRELELQIFEKVLKWQQQRQYDGKRIVPIAVNISPDHFYHPLFIPKVKELIQKYYADPYFIIIEITENMGLLDFERARVILFKLRALGLSTSVDDFGIGYSSLSYLQNFPFNELKIDQSFSQKIDELATQTIVKSIIQIAHMLEMIVIAEGVETFEQAMILKQLKCDVIQGYYYSCPLPIEEASALLDNQ